MVLITALIYPLYKRFCAPVDLVTTGTWSEALLKGQPGVGQIYHIRSRRTPYWLSTDQKRLVRDLKERGSGPVWYCDGNDAAKPLLLKAGIGTDHTVFAKDHDLLPGEHATEQWRRLAHILPASVPAASVGRLATQDTPPGCYLEVSDERLASFREWLKRRGLGGRPLIAVQIGNKRTMRRGFKRLAVNHKYWPPERWAETLRHLRKRHPDHAIVLLGTGPEYQLNEQLRSLAQVSDVHNLADDLSIPRLMALLSVAHGLINVDSGPAHVAAAVGCPQVVLFGIASTALYRPWGRTPSDVKVLTGKVDGAPSMLGIGSEAVCEAWDGLKLR